jgi:hypothetical protein
MITTSFMELLKIITGLTKDDAVVLEIVKRIFDAHSVRLARTLAPVRLVNGCVSRRAARRPGIGRSAACETI